MSSKSFSGVHVLRIYYKKNKVHSSTDSRNSHDIYIMDRIPNIRKNPGHIWKLVALFQKESVGLYYIHII